MGRVTMAVVSSCSVCLGAVTLHSAYSSPGCVWVEDWQCVPRWHVPAACLLDNKMCLKEWGSQEEDSWHSISANSLSWTGEQALTCCHRSQKIIPVAQGFVKFFVGVLASPFLCLCVRSPMCSSSEGPPSPFYSSILAYKEEANRSSKDDKDWVKTDPCCLSPCLHRLIKQMLNGGYS